MRRSSSGLGTFFAAFWLWNPLSCRSRGLLFWISKCAVIRMTRSVFWWVKKCREIFNILHRHSVREIQSSLKPQLLKLSPSFYSMHRRSPGRVVMHLGSHCYRTKVLAAKIPCSIWYQTKNPLWWHWAGNCTVSIMLKFEAPGYRLNHCLFCLHFPFCSFCLLL